jgi:hypothetical protein
MNAQFVWQTQPETWAPHLASMRAAGVDVVRADAIWGFAEPNAPVLGVHTYNWDRFDRLVGELARHNLRWYPTIDYGTPWAATVAGPRGWMSPPKNYADYADYVEAFARRYGSAGSFWATHPNLPRLPVAAYEIWNEPNVEHFFPDQSTAPERYADLYVPAAAAARRGDGSARVVIGGLSSVGVEAFLTRMLAHRPELWSHVDSVAYHPYGGSPAITFDRINVLRTALVRLGAGAKPIEVTETGIATPPTTEERRADVMKELAEALPRLNCGVTRFIPYSWRTAEGAASDPEDWFGIANGDASLKPTALAYRDAVLRMRGLTAGAPSGEVTACSRAKPINRPRLRVRLRLGRLQKRSLRVHANCSSQCRLSLRVLARGKRTRRAMKPRTHVVGRARARFNGRRTFRVRLSRRGLARLRAGRLRLQGRASDAGGARVTIARHVALKRSPRA